MVKRKREIGDGWMQSRIILGPVRWFIILSTVIIVMVPYKVLLLPPVTLPVFSMPTNMDWKGSGSQGVEFSRRRVGHTEFSSLCRLSTWNSIMAQNVTRYTMRGAGDEVRSDCGDAFMLRISKGGRSNPMHNLHDSILPFVFFVRLCGTPHDTIVLPILSTNSGGEPKYEWLPSFLGVIFNSMITDGKIVSKQDAAENRYAPTRHVQPPKPFRPPPPCHFSRQSNRKPFRRCKNVFPYSLILLLQTFTNATVASKRSRKCKRIIKFPSTTNAARSRTVR